jgi:hypothetical protein
MSKNMVESEGPHHVTTWRIRVACWVSMSICMHTPTHARALINTQTYVICSFFLTAIVTRTCPVVTLYVHCLSCFLKACPSLRSNSKWAALFTVLYRNIAPFLSCVCYVWKIRTSGTLVFFPGRHLPTLVKTVMASTSGWSKLRTRPWRWRHYGPSKRR